MIGTTKLRHAAISFETAIRKYVPLAKCDDPYVMRKVLDFGIVTAICGGGEATLWVVFPDRHAAHFKCTKFDKSLLWVHQSQPNTLHTTLQLFRGLSAWWDGSRWIEEQKEVAK